MSDILNNSQILRIIFAGTPDFAAHHLQTLIDSRHQLVSVYTQPDRPSGRGKKMLASPVKQLANRYQLPVFQPVNLKGLHSQRELQEQQADIMVVVAYGLILPPAILQAPRYGCINVHASLLPRWRGAAPIQRAIAAGDRETGITIMQMDNGLDTGPMLSTVRCKIDDTDTSASLHDKLLTLGPPALLEALNCIDKLQPIMQSDEQATYAAKISKREAMIDWSQPAELIERLIRAFNPFPTAFTMHRNQRFKIHKTEIYAETIPVRPSPGTVLKVDAQGILIACGKGSINILQLQLPGKKTMSVRQLLNGYSSWINVGDHLDSTS